MTENVVHVRRIQVSVKLPVIPVVWDVMNQEAVFLANWINIWIVLQENVKIAIWNVKFVIRMTKINALYVRTI